MSKYKIGLFGFGCVGQGLYQALSESENDIEIVKICVKNKDKQRNLAKHQITYEAKDILDDPDINIIVELIDDTEAALSIVKTALSKGKAVVSANKKMIAENMEELIWLQQKYGVPLLYEGAVCGSIPVIRNLQDYYASEQISSIKGIFNGSSNYILTKLFEEGKSYSEALTEAQENGFAETDPSLDVGGYDPKFKLSIILQHAFGASLHPDNIFNWGIEHINKDDLLFAKSHNLKIKLLAKATVVDDELTAWVAPHFISADDPLFHIENEFNCVLIDGKYAHEQTLIGKGAGSLPTGLAVLADVISLTRSYTYEYKLKELKQNKSALQEVYIRFSTVESMDKSIFENISESYIGAEGGYIIGRASLNQLRETLANSQDDINVIFTSGRQHEIEIPRLSYSYAS